MDVDVNEHGTIVFTKVYTPIKLVTDTGETLIITMRDSGFEICYENDFYSLQKGTVKGDGMVLIKTK